MLRAQRPFAAWIAALAVLLAALVPTVSHALSSARGLGWIEVCSAQGALWLRADGKDAKDAPAAPHLIEHCPYCSLHAPVLGMPPAPQALALAPVAGEMVLPASHGVAPAQAAWASAQPRAPPRFS